MVDFHFETILVTMQYWTMVAIVNQLYSRVYNIHLIVYIPWVYNSKSFGFIIFEV